MDFKHGMTGFKELENVLKHLPDKLHDSVAVKAVRAGAGKVRKEIKTNAPVSGFDHGPYGPLSKNIRVTRNRYEETRHSVVVTVHTGKGYWGMFLEFGTVKMPAQPFFAPGLDAAASPALQAMVVTLSTGLVKISMELAGRYGSMKKSTKRRL